ncbi:dihydrodipicolinate synthase family protein [Brachybacterium sp. UMB0905]|uniref:dihydrodipicolinate synthase family protein n=1 Tax=Brachybacterium sp. UMB0905 TaxID=2069310 RepID=UPI001E3038FD|nr:dihydrodipicolinate synthase family protein [Brachybacterium sp. UMB0905]
MSTSEQPAPRLTGVIPPVITPLHEDRTLDVEGLERVLERMLAAGIAGVFALGSTGETAFHPMRVREQIVRETVRIVAGRVPVLVGVVAPQTAEVIERIDQAQELGADAVVATAPFYAITAPAEVERHFQILGEHADIPVYAYDIPVCVHTKLDPAMLVRLGESGAIAGVKDSSGDDVSFRRLILANRAAGSPLSILTGHEVVVDGAYLSGADGCVPGLGNVDPEGYVRLDQAARRGDWEAVRTEQDRLAELMGIAFGVRGQVGWGAGVGSFKTALQLLGVIGSRQVPQPFEALDEADTAMVAGILEAAGLTPASR